MSADDARGDDDHADPNCAQPAVLVETDDCAPSQIRYVRRHLEDGDRDTAYEILDVSPAQQTYDIPDWSGEYCEGYTSARSYSFRIDRVVDPSELAGGVELLE